MFAVKWKNNVRGSEPGSFYRQSELTEDKINELALKKVASKMAQPDLNNPKTIPKLNELFSIVLCEYVC